MSDLSPERRTELRRTLDLLIPARYEAMNMPTADMLALLDASDERDTLAAAVERVRAIHSPGIVYLHADECGHRDSHTVIEGLDGDPLCFDSPTDDRFCTECAGAWDELPAWPCPTIRALDGTDVGDFVIRGVQGEFYPCNPDIFEATYESADS